MRFPVLMTAGRRCLLSYFELRARKYGDYLATERFLLNVLDSEDLLGWMTSVAPYLGQGGYSLQVDWPDDEQEKVARNLEQTSDYAVETGTVRVSGDSWTLPLFLALDRFISGGEWPKNLLASGCIRNAKCLPVSGIGSKLRFANQLAARLLLPFSCVNQIKARGRNTESCLALPHSLQQCLAIWRQL